ncbi:MAG: 5-dehydro-4-deoxy-D-glucuronate isomerase [Firmicutes bacterium]|nr:5-dehydro-4-deoxy-D-glucuronate isomerase [Bacillota bacterium]
MEIRNSSHPKDAKHYTTEDLRKNFLVQDLFVNGKIKLTHSHIDRIIIGGAKPIGDSIELLVGKELGTEYFLERREMGIINIGGQGTVLLDGKEYRLNSRDGLYIGKGIQKVLFASDVPDNPAKFYFNSAPAHKKYPIVKINIEQAKPEHLGADKNSNKRTIYKYIHPDVAKSCQLSMGMTILEPNNVWNTMPAHTHARRMEVYFYFDLDDDNVVFHYMGEPDESRHIIVRNEEAVISPSWSIHSGAGTSNYTFIWGMAGENQTFSDMDHIPMNELK